MNESTKMTYEDLKAGFEKLKENRGLSKEEDPITLQLGSDLWDYSPKEEYITFAFPVIKKELNPNGAMMGGIVCTALDMTYGLLVYALCGGGVIPPTVSMTTNFINAIFFGDTLLITAKVISWGKRIINMRAEGISKKTGKTVVTSTAVFISDADFSLRQNG